jgi:hypothetical protein
MADPTPIELADEEGAPPLDNTTAVQYAVQMQLMRQQQQQMQQRMDAMLAQQAAMPVNVQRQLAQMQMLLEQERQEAAMAAAAAAAPRPSAEQYQHWTAQRVAAAMKEAQAVQDRAQAFQQHVDMTAGPYLGTKQLRDAMTKLHKSFGAFENLIDDQLRKNSTYRRGVAILGATPAETTYSNHPQQVNGSLLTGFSNQPLLESTDFVMTIISFREFAKKLADQYYSTVTEFADFTAKFASNFGIHPTYATGFVDEIADSIHKKRRREEFCDCTRDSCHNTKCKCNRLGRKCQQGCSCWERQIDGHSICRNRSATMPPAAAAASAPPGSFFD